MVADKGLGVGEGLPDSLIAREDKEERRMKTDAWVGGNSQFYLL